MLCIQKVAVITSFFAVSETPVWPQLGHDAHLQRRVPPDLLLGTQGRLHVLEPAVLQPRQH